MEGKDVTLDQVQAPIICIVKERRITAMARNDFVISDLQSGYHFVAVERETYFKDQLQDMCPVVLVVQQNRRSYYIFSE
jgi:hypothetical protein